MYKCINVCKNIVYIYIYRLVQGLTEFIFLNYKLFHSHGDYSSGTVKSEEQNFYKNRKPLVFAQFKFIRVAALSHYFTF